MLAVANWDRWQTFRKDRGTPPWIKLHRCVLTNPEWAMLSDCEKGHLVSLWIIAADKNGQLPTDNPNMLRKICLLDEEPNINKFTKLGFLTTKCQPDDNQVSTKSHQDDAPEKSREEKSREEKSNTFRVPLKGNSFFCPSDSDIDEWKKMHPGVNVDIELLKLIDWNKRNASRRKTKRGIKKHIVTWLGNAKHQESDDFPQELLYDT